MIGNAPIKRAKEDKKCHRSCQSKNSKMIHSSFLSREFSGDVVLSVVDRHLKTENAATQMIKERMPKVYLTCIPFSQILIRIAITVQVMHTYKKARAKSSDIQNITKGGGEKTKIMKKKALSLLLRSPLLILWQIPNSQKAQETITSHQEIKNAKKSFCNTVLSKSELNSAP